MVQPEKSTHMLAFLDQLANRPDILGHLGREYFGVPDDPDKRFTIGELIARTRNLPDTMKPNDPEVVRDLLYMGQGNYEGLLQLTYEGIEAFASSFKVAPRLKTFLNRSVYFTDRAYKAIGSKRKSGERYAAHLLRYGVRQMAAIGALTATAIANGQGIDIYKDSYGSMLATLSEHLSHVHDLYEDQIKGNYIIEQPSLGFRRLGISVNNGSHLVLLKDMDLLTINEQLIRNLGIAVQTKYTKDELETESDFEVTRTQTSVITDVADLMKQYENRYGLDHKHALFFQCLLHFGKGGGDRLDNLLINVDRVNGNYEPIGLERALKIILTTELEYGKLLSPYTIQHNQPEWLPTGYDPVFDYFDPTAVSFLVLTGLGVGRSLNFDDIWTRHELRFSPNGTPFSLYLPRVEKIEIHGTPCIQPEQMCKFSYINGPFRRQKNIK